MTKISIRQPGYLPFMGFFKKIQSSDIFVYLDDVQYERGDWDNRNKIRTSNGTTMLTVPVYNRFGQNLNEVKITNTQNWSEKHMKTIQNNYNKSQFFEKYWNKIESILSEKWEKLIDLNLALIEFFYSELNLTTKTIFSSKLKLTSGKSQRLLEICQALNATTYISGEMGKTYLDEEIFKNAGIQVVYEKFQHPVYNQIHGDFIPNLSVIDLLFNEGDNSKKILHKSSNL